MWMLLGGTKKLGKSPSLSLLFSLSRRKSAFNKGFENRARIKVNCGVDGGWKKGNKAGKGSLQLISLIALSIV